MCLGIPGQIVDIDETFQLARVDVSGVKRSVNVSLLLEDGLQAGDWVLIHVGFAMSKIDEKEAQETLNLLYEMGQIMEDEIKMYKESRIE